ncbi:MAG TPA: hypothetical protein DCX71_12000 [Erythrobacter sp.]|jgi:hypothetical protein|uniref:ImmA/IrrE family metallo-endopeptidase n=1 Tax=Qipengyuania citrea TaxID=225971 RepID=A0A6I4UFP9_9SPHN|nr:ImmA/IrrE family metallo-endopeptidase [Qipengyuania citrea]MAG42507.1 hypothetical protein [Erythrobacteraceae bacterium]HAW36787.1 hypothetical protein [Erythrobacter sp.]MCD1591009.1 ImmA/IrrE family metallo-endopeptidase [Qipengyuania citrea]MDQ0567086.1 hypothetical protein [Qipengyuania citrea]MXP36574.1 ImmA/IrrE family metallo-endopeptidase [Qipengyuania citrea]|tara:strand:- start:2236 stop:3123 length:888 start_codon:yes stop_codon:yes gene_type:complete
MAGKFRLLMATQTGQKRARDEGFHSFPVDPFAIAAKHDIHIEEKPAGMQGVSGALIFAEPRPIIIYSAELENEGFERFSVAHELGHYFLPDHPDQILKAGGQHFSRAGFTEGTSSIELEADHFAAGLLMPAGLVRSHLERHQVGLEGICRLAEDAHVSLTAAAIRAAECASFPLCVVVSNGGEVRYAFSSDAFKSLGTRIFLRKGDPLPAGVTAAFNARSGNVTAARRSAGECDLKDWFDTDRHARLDEEVIGIGRYGFTLTILSSEALAEPDDDGEEDEEAVIDRWTPRFAYGR